MAKLYQNNFVGGVISPSLYARSDLAIYYKAAAEAENFVVSKEGSLRKRTGITTLCQLPADWSATKVVPYTYDRTQGGILVLSASGTTLTCRFYDKSGTLKQTINVNDFAGDIKKLQYKQIGDQVWITNGSFYKIITVTDNTSIAATNWSQSAKPSPVNSISSSGHKSDGTDYNPTSGRTITYAAYVVKNGVLSERKTVNQTWPTTWTAGYYINVGVSITAAMHQDNDFDYILLAKKVGSLFGELTRWYPEDFTSTSMTFKDENVSAGELVYSQTNILGENFANPLCVDCFQQRKVFANAENYETAQTGTQTSTGKNGTVVTLDSGRVIQSVEARIINNWTNVTSSCTISGNSVTIGGVGTSNVNLRLNWSTLGGSKKYPMTLWFSEVANIDNFYADRPAADDDPFSPTIMSTGPAFIRHVCTYQEQMIVFTDCGIFTISFAQTAGFSASSCRISRVSDIAIAPSIPPISTATGIVFVGADQKTVYSCAYDLQENAVKPINRSVLTEHITRRSKVVAMGLQQFPQNVVWTVLEDGTMATFTIERDEEVYAWSTHRITDANVLDVISLGTVTDGTNDRTYGDLAFVVSKTVGNTTTCYLARNNATFKDSIGGTETNVKATLVTLRPEMQDRTIVGIAKNVHDVLIRVFETGGLTLVSNNGQVETVRWPDGAVLDANNLYSGDVKLMPRGYVNDLGQMKIVSDNASNAEILAVVQKMELGA